MVPVETDPEIGVVICHHTGRLVNDAIQSVLCSKGYFQPKVVVVTSDKTYLKDCPYEDKVTLVYEEGGPAHKRNVGTVRFTKSEYVVYLDDDATVGPYSISNFYQFMDHHRKCGIAFGKIYKMDRRNVFDDCGSWLTWTGFLWARAQNNQEDTGQYDKAVLCLSSKSAFCMVRRDSFLKAGMFDATYYILGEETDLSWRIGLQGKECWYVPSAVAWHAFDTPLKPKQDYYTLERIHFHGSKNYIQMLITNLGLWRLLCVIPIHLFAWFAAAVSFMVKGDSKRCWLILRGIFWNFTHLPAILAKRRKVQQSRVVNDKVLLLGAEYRPPVRYYTDRFRRYVTQAIHG